MQILIFYCFIFYEYQLIVIMQQSDQQDNISIQGDERIKIPTISSLKLVPSIQAIEPLTPVRLVKPASTKQLPQHKIQQMLQLIFEHFCKKTYESKPNTFDQLKHQVMVLSLNKYMIFSRDFGFLAHKMISMIDLVTIFKKCSANFKEMNFKQFKNSLVKISDHSFKKEEESERYILLLNFMKLGSEQEFKEQMKKIKISIPESLIVPRHGNNFKIYPHCGKFSGDIKKELELRKERKIKIAKSVEKKVTTLSPPSITSTKYSEIYANRTKTRFQLNNVISMAKQQTQYSNRSKQRNYSSTKNQGGNYLEKLVEQEQQDEVLEEMYRRQRGHRSVFSNAIQQRLNKLQREEGKRVATENLIAYR